VTVAPLRNISYLIYIGVFNLFSYLVWSPVLSPEEIRVYYQFCKICVEEPTEFGDPLKVVKG
jgi:hypothetical protein